MTADRLVAEPAALDCPRHLAPALRLHVAETVGGHLRHGLKNKLGNLRNAGFLLKRRAAPLLQQQQDDKTAGLFDILTDQVKEADAMLETLRILPTPGDAPSIDLVACVTRLLGALAPPAGLTLQGPGAAQPLHVSAEPLELEVAIFLLLENAAEAAGGSGVVEVGVGPASGDRVMVEVLDRGPGLQEEARRRALEPFYSSRGPCGLGLKVAQRIAHRWGGDVEVGDRPGGGARAALLLPIGVGHGGQSMADEGSGT